MTVRLIYLALVAGSFLTALIVVSFPVKAQDWEGDWEEQSRDVGNEWCRGDGDVSYDRNTVRLELNPPPLADPPGQYACAIREADISSYEDITINYMVSTEDFEDSIPLVLPAPHYPFVRIFFRIDGGSWRLFHQIEGKRHGNVSTRDTRKIETSGNSNELEILVQLYEQGDLHFGDRAVASVNVSLTGDTPRGANQV